MPGHLDVGGGIGPVAGLGELHPAAAVLADRGDLAGDDDLFASKFAWILGNIGEGDAARRGDGCTIHRFRNCGGGRRSGGSDGPLRVGAGLTGFDATTGGTAKREHERRRREHERREKTGGHGAHDASA